MHQDHPFYAHSDGRYLDTFVNTWTQAVAHRVSQSCSPVDLFFFRLQITIMIHDKRLYSFPSSLCDFA